MERTEEVGVGKKSKKERKNKEQTSLVPLSQNAKAVGSLSCLFFEIRPLPFFSSLRRPATMSKTIALFDVDGTLTVPRKVRGAFWGARRTERKRQESKGECRSKSIDGRSDGAAALSLSYSNLFLTLFAVTFLSIKNRLPMPRRSTFSRSCAR